MKTTFLLTIFTTFCSIESLHLSDVPGIVLATFVSGFSYIFWAWIQYFVRKKWGTNILPPTMARQEAVEVPQETKKQ